MLAAAALAASLAAFAPVVVHDANERYPLAPASRSSDTRPTVYARARDSCDLDEAGVKGRVCRALADRPAVCAPLLFCFVALGAGRLLRVTAPGAW